MLRDLKLPDSKSINKHVGEHNNDAMIAGAIVERIFYEIGSCVQGDRSKVKLNMFEKGVIGGMMSDKVKNGIKNYVFNMSDQGIKNLLNGIQLDLNKRKI